ncbi:MAG: cysteine desulfurase family protein [Alphaproteobacteria bacterium]
MIYLDYNATAPIRPAVIARVAEVMGTVGNASSVHAAGRAAREIVEDARAEVAALVGAKPDGVILLSGGTEANNLALKGVGKRRLMVAGTEHGAVLAPTLLLDGQAVLLPVDGDGRLDLDALDKALSAEDGPALVSVMLANNETGVLQPVAEIAEIAHRHGALFHCDAVQAAGKVPVDMAALGIDMLSLSAHKIGGPQGIGALVLNGDIQLDSQIVGGGQEQGRRSGTENVAGAAGYGVAAKEAREGLAKYAELGRLRDDMERRLRQVTNGLVVHGAGAPRLPNTSCLSMPGVSSETQVIAFDLAGIAISAGSACSSGKVHASHVLEAMAVPEETATSAIRVSMGWNTEPGDIDRLVEVWTDIYRRGQRSAA